MSGDKRNHKKGGSMTTSNHLSHIEMYSLTKLVEAAIEDGTTSDNYAGAMEKFSKQLGHSVTKANLDTAAKSCGKSVTDLIKADADTSPMARIMRIVRALETRVAALEEAFK